MRFDALPRCSRTVVLSVASLGATFTACSVLLDADVVQCASDRDCEGKGLTTPRCVDRVCVSASDAPSDGGVDAAGRDSSVVDSKWGCLGNVVWGSEDPKATVKYQQMFVRLLGYTPVVSVAVEACSSLDPNCLAPVSSAMTGSDGIVHIDVPKNFRGYLNLKTPPTTLPTMVPSLHPITPPPQKDTDRVFDPFVAPVLVTSGELNSLLSLVGASTDPGLGHVFGYAVDCLGAPAAGVAFTASTRDAKTIAFYYAGNATPTISETKTDSTGVAGFINLPAGVVDIKLQLVATGQFIGRYSVAVKKGVTTTLDFWPTPP